MVGAVRDGCPPTIRKGSGKGPKTFRMVLNTSFSSPQAWLLLAQDRGYLDEAGIALELTAGEGAYTAPSRMAAQGFDLGYGDINALIVLAASGSDLAPIGIQMMFGASPSAIAVKADGPVGGPADLPGRTIIGHDTDVALRTFGAFCLRAGVDRSRVTCREMHGDLHALIVAMLESDGVDGVFGYVSTIRSALAAKGVDDRATLRFIPYADHVPELYGSCVMASPRMLEEEGAALAAIVRAFGRGILDMRADPQAAIDAVARRRPDIPRAAERLRLRTTLEIEMATLPHPASPGEVDLARLTSAIALIVESQGLPATPRADRIFTNRFLAPGGA